MFRRPMAARLPTRGHSAMTDAPLAIAVVGHSNAGKTSLLRTLLRDSRFGQVAPSPGTTRHVEGSTILADDQAIIAIYDTPGLEDSIGLLAAILEIEATTGRARLQGFLQQLADDSPFHQEAKVIRQLLGDDLIFYVIDCREPVLGKYIDELTIIAMAGKPVIPVLNFIGDNGHQLPRWEEQLADMGLHAIVRFDTVIFNFEDEKRLYQKIQALVTSRHNQLQLLIDDRQRQWQEQLRSARGVVAELLVNVAGYRISVGEQSPARERDHFFAAIRRAEQESIDALLQLFRFEPGDLRLQQLPITDGRWHLDLFDRDNLKTFGLDAGSNAAKGAAIGVGIDALTGGLTLGLAATLGAVAGFTWSTGRRFRRELGNLIAGRHFIHADDSTLAVLYLRQRLLLNSLQHRGHAAQGQLELAAKEDSALPEHWPQWLSRARQHPEWSALNGEPEATKARAALVEQIGDSL